MSDGPGGAPQLDERRLEAATRAFVDAQEAGRVNEPSPYPLAEGIRAYLAASPGAGELDLTDEDHESFDALWYAVDGLKQTIAFSPAVSGRVSTANLWPAVEAFLEAWGATEPARVKLAKLRARLDRKDDEV